MKLLIMNYFNSPVTSSTSSAEVKNEAIFPLAHISSWYNN
jgi:hypothetical protein